MHESRLHRPWQRWRQARGLTRPWRLRGDGAGSRSSCGRTLAGRGARTGVRARPRRSLASMRSSRAYQRPRHRLPSSKARMGCSRRCGKVRSGWRCRPPTTPRCAGSATWFAGSAASRQIARSPAAAIAPKRVTFRSSPAASARPSSAILPLLTGHGAQDPAYGRPRLGIGPSR